jgi:small subunit ribosomal protein S11
MATKNKSKKKKSKRTVSEGIAHIRATFNNTHITITDPAGNVVAWSSAGASGFKGSRKGTPFAAQQASEKAGRSAIDMGMRTVNVRIKGPGSGRESAVRGLGAAGLQVNTISDVTPIPHNGCRPPKKRRV